ncbi:MAG TPA: MFS transporter [Bacillales bacterium]
MPKQTSWRMIVILGAVFVSGLSQGMLIPLISILLEKSGVSSAFNGFNASALYIGIMLASPFIEKPLRHYGYKPVMVVGLFIAVVSTLLFPIWQAFWFWFILRMIIGIGDNMLNFAAQLWMIALSKKSQKGRNIAFYGLAFGLGFAVGPLMTNLLAVSEWLPFVASACLSFLVWLSLNQVQNELPDSDMNTAGKASWNNYKQVLKSAWTALIATAAYGFLESSLNGNFPVYALRAGLDIKWVSILLPIFVIGSLITQIPLGNLTDRIGGKKVLLMASLCGSLCFFASVLVQSSPYALLIIFFIAGMTVGSLFSLSITYMVDLLPANLLPTGNIIVGIAFGTGSIFGPLVGGFLIEWVSISSFFYSIGAVILIAFLAVLLKDTGYLFSRDRRVTKGSYY